MTPPTSPNRPAPIDVFISYSHKDEDLRAELDTHLSLLKQQRKIAAWHDRMIEAGAEWEVQLKAKLESASIVLFLVSADFMASEYCYDKEMHWTIDRHNDGKVLAIPIILRPCDWQGTLFSGLQALPKDQKPVTLWDDRDSAFLDITQGIRRSVDSIAKKTTNRQPSNVDQENNNLALRPPLPPWERAGLRVPGYSPFITGTPIEHPKNFFGRGKELKHLFNLLKTHTLRNALIIGKKESGKTSLLNYLQSITTTSTIQLRPGQKSNWLTDARFYRWISVDFQDVHMAQQERLLRYLLESMHLPVPALCDLASFMDQVSGRVLQPTIILIDNVDIGLKCYTDLDDDFWTIFLSLTTNQEYENLVFVMTSSTKPNDLSGNSLPFLSFLGETIYLSPFTEDEAKDLILSSPLPFAETDINQILTDSNCWPVLVQEKCKSHFFYLKNNKLHPNFIVGGVQLLFQFIFAPSVWHKQLQHLDPSLNKSFLLKKIFKQDFWKQNQTRQLVIQALFLLPVLCVLPLIVGLLPIANTPVVWNRILLGTFYITAMINVSGLLLGLSSSMQLIKFTGSSGLCILFLKTALLLSHELIFIASVILFVIGIWSNLLFSISYEVSNLSRKNTGKVNIAIGLFISVVAGIVFSQPYNFLFGFRVSIAFLAGYAIEVWRPLIMAVLFIPWHILIYRIDQKQAGVYDSLLPKHIAFLDEFQYLPIWGLDKHLLLVLENNPIEGQAILKHLKISHQKWAARSAQVELNYRHIERCSNAVEIGRVQYSLNIDDSPAATMFHTFAGISIDVNTALYQSRIDKECIDFTAISDRLTNLINELTISKDKYAIRFRPIAQCWQKIIDRHLHNLIREINSPYISNIPVTNRKQLFIGRTDISERLEKLLLDRRSPPLLLYGQRRTGKTSLLNNLGRLLPTSIIPLFVDLQGSISSAKDHTGFLYNLAKAMINSAQRQRNLKLPPLSYETLATDPFTRFDEWLDTLETALAGNTALLALDEFEALDRVLNEGRFNENDVLGMLRNLIQHRPTFKVLLAGSHTLDEFQRWSSYLINAQVIHLGYLQESEARQLIETPIENFALRYQPPTSQRVLDITQGHPFLVQLLCAEIVALKNNQDPSVRRLATLADVEAAIPEALEHGSMFFSDIERNQLDAPALAVLRYCAQKGEAATISKSELEQRFSLEFEGAIDLLLRRELIEVKPAGYCIQLELIRRWFDR